MSTSLTLANILGPMLVIIAVGILLNINAYQEMIGEMQASSSLWYLGGLLALMFGLLIVQWHNVWVWQWPVVITVLGWAGLLKGILLLVFPKSIVRWAGLYQRNTLAMKVHAAFALLLGLFLTVMGLTG